MEGYTGVLPSHLAPRGAVPVQRSGPRKPSGRAGVGGTGAAGVSLGDGGRGRSWVPPLRGPVGPAQAGPPCTQDLADCPPTAKGARFDLIFSKVSQNDEVSPEKC